MFDPQTLILFTGAVLMLAAMPGPDNLFVSAQSLAHGHGAGLAAAGGIALGGLMWTLAATAGLTALMATMPAVLVLVQIGGAAYLVYLAVGLWRSKDAHAGATPPVAHAFVRGLTTNLLNPKVGLYYLAFLPQFVNADNAPIWMQMLVLGLIFNIAGTLVMGVTALLAGSLKTRLDASQGVARFLPRFAALVLFGIAGKLLWGLRA